MYRYSKSEFSSLLLTMGILRVGTLHDFRNEEHKVGIADSEEGKKTVHHLVESLSGDFHTDASMLSQWGINIAPGANVNISNVAFQRNMEAPNRFVLCFSARLSRQTMQQFEGADSCIEIVNKVGFFSTLTKTINAHTPVTFLGVHEVQYRPRVELWNGADFGVDPSLIKENRYSSQYELRALWEPRFDQSIHPMILGDYQLGRFCKVQRLTESG
ncbi:MAG: hypothetical protein HY846_01800 [Nitrosomonadales bacterium]|nr:hypothetical protein [Nitrosomonadales bacterium]